jgi:hypothetical protein
VAATLTALILILIALQVHKAFAILKHILWIYRFGRHYADLLVSLRRQPGNVSERDVYLILIETGGHKLSWLGFKEYNLRIAAMGLRESSYLQRRLVGRLIQSLIVVYDFVILGFLGGVALICVGLYLHTGKGQCVVLKVLGSISCALLMLTVVIICIEATVNYARLTSFGLAHHNPKAFASGRDIDPFLTEIATLVGVSLAAVYLDACTLFFLYSADMLEGFVVDRVDLMDFLYHSFMTFVLSGQLSVTNPVGEVWTVLVTLHGIAVVVIAVAAFSSATPISRLPSDPQRME